eukprot:gene1269-727_t
MWTRGHAFCGKDLSTSMASIAIEEIIFDMRRDNIAAAPPTDLSLLQYEEREKKKNNSLKAILPSHALGKDEKYLPLTALSLPIALLLLTPSQKKKTDTLSINPASSLELPCAAKPCLRLCLCPHSDNTLVRVHNNFGLLVYL